MHDNRIDIRPAAEDEMPAFQDVVADAFATSPATPLPTIAADWSLCGFVGRRLAATSGVWPFNLRYNGAHVAAAGVTMVATAPEFRRRGLARELMTRTLCGCHERGLPFAILWASYAAIYQRFGYGPASTGVYYDFDPRRVPLLPGPAAGGQVLRLSRDDALARIKPVYIEYASPRNLMLHRAGALWAARVFLEGPGEQIRTALYQDANATPRGYVVYLVRGPNTLSTQPSLLPPNQELIVRDFVALDIDAYRGLWNYLIGHDLVRTVRMGPLPDDDPAPLLVTEPRQLARRTTDGLWMRITHVRAALAARPYADTGALTLQVDDDPAYGSPGGRYHLETDGVATDVQPARGAADLTLGPRALAMLLSGWRSATALSRAGLLEATHPTHLSMADRIFRTTHRPYCPDTF